MARTPKPWWWKARQEWAVTIGGKRYRLGTDREKAMEEFHRLMASGRQVATAAAADYLNQILRDFLGWVHREKATKTYRIYYGYISSFDDRWPGLRLSELRPRHVESWLADHVWGPTSRNKAIGTISRALNWASRQGYGANPIAAMERPTPKNRVDTLSLGEFATILRHTRDRRFREFLTFCWDCGCRPQEGRAIESRHVDLAHQRCVLPTGESKGKHRARAIYLATPRAARIVARLMAQHPAGPLFRNTWGTPWNCASVYGRLQRMDQYIGRRIRAYTLRHTWITRQLKAGVDSHVVASLAGHANTAMIDKVYSHVADDPAFMLEAARRGTGFRPSGG